MKLFKLTAVASAVLGSSMAMAATQQAVIVDNTQPANQAVVVADVQPAYQVQEVQAQPANQDQAAYQYDQNAGVVANTAGAVTGTAKTLFDTATHPAAVSAEIGTLGYGANIAWGLNDTTELTAGWNGFSKDGTEDLDASDSWINWGKVLGDGWGNFEGDMKYDADFSNPYLGANLRPWANNFTIGAGILIPDNELEATLTPTSDSADVKINGKNYTIPTNESVHVEVENKNKLAPYLTLGFRPNINQNWGGFFEAGAAYMGKLDAKVTQTEGVQEGLSKAAENDIEEDDVWYPIVKAGLTYRF